MILPEHLVNRLKACYMAARAAWKNGALALSKVGRPIEPTEVLERSSDCVIQIAAFGTIIYFNPAARVLLGPDLDSLFGRVNYTRFAAAGTRRQMLETVLPALMSNGVWVGETSIRLGARRKVPFSLMAMAHRGADRRVDCFSAVLRDISEDVQSRQQIQRQHDILGAIAEALPATVVIVDSKGRYRFANSAFERYVGLAADQIIGRTAIEVLGAAEVERREPYMRRALAGEPVQFTLDYPSADGTTSLSLNCIPLNVDGLFDGFVGISQDITVLRREEERLSRLAERDPLTGLLNRAGFARQGTCGPGDTHALLYIDLDHFKAINDQFGHQVGDELLQIFSRRLSQSVRSSDAVARLGGDEFAILLKGAVTVEAAEAVAKKVLAAARASFEMGSRTVRISASVGVSFMSGSEDSLAELMARADRLLYRAKESGRGRHFLQAPSPRTEPGVGTDRVGLAVA